MLKRLKRTLVESYIGAIALGYLLAQVILRFVAVFVSPVDAWAMRAEFEEFAWRLGHPGGAPFKYALSELASFLLLFLIWYLLLRWLYFKPFKEAAPEPVPDQSQRA